VSWKQVPSSRSCNSCETRQKNCPGAREGRARKVNWPPSQ